ncbi:MAG: hypothetical protein BGO45_01890 [Microbacterium sp. 71-36]|nr:MULTISPECIES: hypothetical protein [unclassified Microbacterium]ODT39188.1 MAG: hypothetical protein ABS60_07365 [Microbacterium sp. SCN 71-17]OJV74322.1 MAG: hypothetical protein BGO45_01890 [Microbacterium sp. 71-36]
MSSPSAAAPPPSDVPGVPADPAVGAPPAEQAAPLPPSAGGRRPRASVVVLAVLLTVFVAAVGLGFLWLATQLQEARTQIDDQRQQIDDQQQRLDEQQEMIDRKEQFGAAMNDLYATVDPLVGLPYATIVPWYRVEDLADRAWIHRRNPAALDQDVADLRRLTSEISVHSAAVAAQAASNASGTAWEATLDSLGRGWVSTVFEDATPCGATALACVSGAEPFTVHVRAGSRTDPTMTDWIRTGAAYHEYAHVLQFTNPQPTDDALASFGGDVETMADCYALTFLDGWSLDHEVAIDAYSYYEVNVGYGYTCDANQRQVIRDWVGRLGVTRQVVGG